MSSYTDRVNAHARESGQPHVSSHDHTGTHGHLEGGVSATTHGGPNWDQAPYRHEPIEREQGHEVDHRAELEHTELNGHHGNHPEGHTVMHGFDRREQTMDSPVPERDRQMPDRSVTSKAEEVRQAVRENPETFPAGGVMDR